MPSSKKSAALGRLKQNLKDAGLIKQKTKKGRVQKITEQAKAERRKAVQALKEQSNPFELKMTKQKHEVLGRKVKGVTGKPGLAKKKSYEVRKNKLLPEMLTDNKETTFDDKRIGEKNANMTIEDKMFERFLHEQKRRASKGVFNLEDDHLTHMGRSLDEFNGFTMPGSFEDEDDEISGAIDFKTVRGSHFGGFDDELEEDDGRKKSKNEVMQELIAKSKFYKHQRQQQREEDMELGMKLDAELDELRDLLQPRKRSDAPEDKSSGLLSQKDAYDQFVKELASEKRAQPTERRKTEEELALEEKERLEKLETDRLKRMHGQMEPRDQSKRIPTADDLEDDFVAGSDEDDAAPLAYQDGKIINNKIFMKSSARDEEEEADSEEYESEEGDSSDAEDDGSEDEEVNEESEDDQDSQDEDNDLEDDQEEMHHVKTTQKKKSPQSNSTTSDDTVPYIIEAPECLEDFVKTIKGKSAEAVRTIIQRLRVLNHVKLGPGNKERLIRLLEILIEYIQVADYEKETLNYVFGHIFELSQQFHEHATQHIKSILESTQMQLSKSPAYPSTASMMLIQLISRLFAVSDFKHQIAIPCLTLICKCLSHLPITSTSEAITGLYLCRVAISFVEQSKRLIPEVLGYCYRVLSCFGPKQSVATSLFQRMYPHHPLDQVKTVEGKLDSANATPIPIGLLYDDVEETEEQKQQIIFATVTLLSKLSPLYADQTVFADLFGPLDAFIKSCTDGDNSPFESIQSKLEFHTNKCRFIRRPLQLQKRKPIPIASYVPKFNERFSLDRKSMDPDRERSEQQRMKHQYKKEFKGALRELKKDASFIAKQKIQTIREKDAQYKRKINQIMGDLGSQESVMKGYDKMKKARR